MFKGPRLVASPSPEQFVQLISEAEGRQVEVLEIVQLPKPGEKSSKVSPLTRVRGDVRQTKALQVDHLSKKVDNVTQFSPIHFQVFSASQIQKLQDIFVGRHVVNTQASAAEVQGPKVLLNFTLKEGMKLFLSQGTIDGKVQ